MNNEKWSWIANALLLVFAKVDVVTVVVEITVTKVCFCSVGNENGNGACVTCVLLWTLTSCSLIFKRFSLENLYFLFAESFWDSSLSLIVTVAKFWEEKKMVFSTMYSLACSFSSSSSFVFWFKLSNPAIVVLGLT